MTKPFGRWCAGIALLSLSLGLSLSRPETAIAAGTSDPSAAAGVAASAVMSEYGSAEGIRETASVPLTAGGRLHSIDGSESGTVQLTQASSTAFMSMVGQPGGTGDLSALAVTQDTDFDGTDDYSYSVPFPVSGVCANGLISCDPGTWANCTFYKWTADAEGRVSLALTLQNQLGGCYCINSSCGSDLVWNNLALVMKDLGGGAAGAIQARKNGYVITQVSQDGPSITYYGQDTTNPASGEGGSNPQTQYLGNPGALSSDAETQASTQSTDPTSYYSMLETSFASKGSSQESRTCKIDRMITPIQWCNGPITNGSAQSSGACGAPGVQTPTVVFDWTVTYRLSDQSTGSLTGSASQALCVDHLMFTRTQTFADGKTLFVQWEGTDPTGTNVGWNCGGAYASWMTVATVALPDNVEEWDAKINVSYSGGGCSSGSAVIDSYWCDQTCGVDESIDDQCSALESDQNCKLRDEVVDSVSTYWDFNPTGLSPLPSDRTVTGNSCQLDVTRNWWEKDRTYLCQTDNTFTFDDLAQRTGAIDTSVEANSSTATTINYTDKRIDPTTGSWVTDQNSIDIPAATASSDACQHICETRKPSQDTDAGESGPTTNYRTSNQSYDFYYKTCDSSDYCPLSANEEIMKPCQCINEFAEATAALQVLEAAGKDIICSDGTKK